MPLLRAYLNLRRRLLGRQLREVGWLRLVVLVPLLLLVVVRSLVILAGHPLGQWAVPVDVVLLLTSIHRQRSDLRFLATSAPGYQRWLAVEYVLWALPVAVVLVLFKDGGAAALTGITTPHCATSPRISRRTAMPSGRPTVLAMPV